MNSNNTISTVFDIDEQELYPINTTTEDVVGYSKSFWIALGTSVITNLIQAFALSYQRKSHLLNDLVFPRECRKSAWKRPMWLIAFISFTTANIVGSIFSIGYLPIVILAPIGAMNLVFNAFAANIVLGDPLSKQSILGTGLIALGALLVGFFGVIPEPNHSLSDLILLYRKSGFIIYFSILETIIVATMLITHYLEYCCSLIELREEITQKKVHGYNLDDMKRYIGISYGILSGNVSSQSMLFAKSGIELIILSIAYEQNQLQYPLTWFLLFMMILTGGMQLYYLNKGLRLCDTMTLIPLSFCAFNVSCLFNGLIYYNQWDRFRWWQLMYVMSGVVVTIFGVLLLSWQNNNNSNQLNNKSSGAVTIGSTIFPDNEPSTLSSSIHDDEEEVEYIDHEDGDSQSSQVNLLVKKTRRRYSKDVYDQKDGPIKLSE